MKNSIKTSAVLIDYKKKGYSLYKINSKFSLFVLNYNIVGKKYHNLMEHGGVEYELLTKIFRLFVIDLYVNINVKRFSREDIANKNNNFKKYLKDFEENPLFIKTYNSGIILDDDVDYYGYIPNDKLIKDWQNKDNKNKTFIFLGIISNSTLNGGEGDFLKNIFYLKNTENGVNKNFSLCKIIDNGKKEVDLSFYIRRQLNLLDKFNKTNKVNFLSKIFKFFTK